jgi:DNA-binding GntR family transcriptional regulator
MLMDTPTRARRTQLPEEVAAYVRELIISGAVRPGEFLRLETISKAVGVSNTPAREGLLLLKSEGFVRLIPRRGFVVTPFSANDIHDLFWAQAQLASELAARAATKITADQIAYLERNIVDYGAAIEANSGERIAELGHQFHRAINLAADSNRLALLLGSFVRHLPNRFYAEIEGHLKSTHDEHPILLEALKAHDPEKARELMSHHIMEGAEGLIASLEKRGLWSDSATAETA